MSPESKNISQVNAIVKIAMLLGLRGFLNDNNYWCNLCATFYMLVLSTAAGCGKFYHSKCLKLFPQTKFNRGKRKEIGLQLDPAGNNEDPLPLEILSCARHTCHTCCSDNPAEAAVLPLEKLVRCVKCATSYHSANFCLPAGTEVCSATVVIAVWLRHLLLFIVRCRHKSRRKWRRTLIKNWCLLWVVTEWVHRIKHLGLCLSELFFI